MLRCLKSPKPIHISEPANTLNYSGLIHGLIGWDVQMDSSSSWLEEEDVSTLTTFHQAVVISHITIPMETEKRKAG